MSAERPAERESAGSRSLLPPRLDLPAAPIPFRRLVVAEMRKAVDTRTGLWLFIICGALTLAALAIPLSTDTETKYSNYVDATTLLQGVFLLPVIGVMVSTSEWSKRTGLTTFTIEPRRERVGVAKMCAALVLGLGVVLFALAVAAAAALLGSLLRGSGPMWDVSPLQLLGVLLMQLVYVAMGVGFGLLLQNTAAAIMLYLFLPLVWTFIGGSSPVTRSLAAWLNTITTLVPLAEGRVSALQWAQLGTTVLAWVVLPFALGLWRLRRAELS